MTRAAAVAVLIAWCFVLLAMRILWSGTWSYAFLVWNLFLAGVPLVAALVLSRARSRAAIAVSAVTWLAFLPNAPYIATDLMHLRPRAFVPLWYDVVLLLSSAVAGILLGYISLTLVQQAIRARIGAAAGWIAVTAVLFLSAFGIYLGRFRRWNSWELITDPWTLLADAGARIVHPRTLGVTIVYGLTLVVGYVVFHLLFADQRRVISTPV
ncbi:MAG TPA: DUF1361 domain-containing protein [Thermoanaerobaculia bacterium]|nr:DUF1361 domain-containing protein [Thermoanaerobaculia bacterium]